ADATAEVLDRVAVFVFTPPDALPDHGWSVVFLDRLMAMGAFVPGGLLFLDRSRPALGILVLRLLPLQVRERQLLVFAAVGTGYVVIQPDWAALVPQPDDERRNRLHFIRVEADSVSRRICIRNPKLRGRCKGEMMSVGTNREH